MAINNPKVGVGVFVWKDDKFLMCKRIGAHGSNTWSLPGGHLEFNESWADCAKREVMEETGMTVENVRFLAATNDLFPGHNKHYVTIWVECDWENGKPSITEPDKCLDQQWETFATLPSPLFEPCWKNLKEAKPELFK